MVIKGKLKRALVSLMASTVMISAFSTTVSACYTPAPSSGNPNFTVIHTASDLDTIVRKNTSGNYRLGNDIDLTGYVSSTNSSSGGWTPISTFKGTFDGDGYSIKGLWSTNGKSSKGLFSELKCATVKNLTIEIGDRGIYGGCYTGGLAGSATSAYIDGCNVTGGAVTACGDYAGGLVGYVYNSTITRSCTAVNVSTTTSYAGGLVGKLYYNSIVSWSSATGNVTAGYYKAGGLVGKVYKSSVSDAYARGNVSAKGYVGGFVGIFYCGSTVSNSYSSGSVSGSGCYVGAFTGYSGVTFKGTNYYDSSKAGVSAGYAKYGCPSGSASAFPQGKPTAQMMKQSTFTGWTFAEDKWQIAETQSYPYFGFCECLANINVAFEKNAADATGTMAVQGFKKNVPAALNHNQFSRPGYSFIGWSTTPTGSVAYADGQTASFSTCTTLYAVWTPSVSNITVQFVRNKAGATGTMSPQTMVQNAPTALSKNQFEHTDFVFLGWSKSPTGNAEYADSATVSFSQNTILYAVWGEPDLYGSMVGDRDSAFVGETINYTVTLGNRNTSKSTPLYSTVLEVNLSEHVSYTTGSLVITKNGIPVTLSNQYNPATHKLIVNIGQLDPGFQYVVDFETVVLPTGEGQVIYNTFTANGDLAFDGFYRSQSKPYSKTFEASAPVTVLPSQQSQDSSSSTVDNSNNSGGGGKVGIGGGTSTTIH